MEVLSLVANPTADCYLDQVAALEELGVEVTTLSPPGREDETVGASRSPADYLRFYPTVLSHSLSGYDLVHAHYGLTAPAAVAQPARPVVITLWGSDLFGRFGPLSRWCARRADATVVMSKGMAEALGSPAHVIPFGVDLELFEPRSRSAALDAVGWTPGAKHVLFPYPPNREVKDYPRARRVVEAARARVAEPVELHTLSGEPHDRMPEFMNAADALLMTSVHEGSPNTVKEAMACNTPVVSTDVGDVAERLAGVEPSVASDDDADLVDVLVAAFREGTSNGREAVRDESTRQSARQVYRLYGALLDD